MQLDFSFLGDVMALAALEKFQFLCPGLNSALD